jgi:hypothetical protein
LASTADRVILAVTPKDMMQTTDPVRQVTLKVGQSYSMDFYGVMRKPEFSAVLARVPYTRSRRHSNDGLVNSYDIRVEGLPQGARFEPVGNDGYRLTWTPTSTGSYTANVRLEAAVYEKVIPIPLIRDDKRLERSKSNPLRETLRFDVVQ